MTEPSSSSNSPALRATFSYSVVDDAVLLTSERESFLLTGSIYAELLPLLDGTRTEDDLIEALPEQDPIAVSFALARLQTRGYLRSAESGSSTSTPESVMAEALAMSPDPGQDHRIALIAPAEVRSVMHAALGALGIQSFDVSEAQTKPPPCDLVLVAVHDYLGAKTQETIATAIGWGLPVIPCDLQSIDLWLGPRLNPDTTPCWECLQDRLRLNSPVRNFLAETGRATSNPAAFTQGTLAGGSALVASELDRNFRGDDILERTLLIHAWDERRSSRHPVTSRPQCPHCGTGAGTPGAGEAIPMPLRGQLRGEREWTIPEALDRLADVADPITGLVTSERRSATLATDGHEFVTVEYPFNARIRRLDYLRQSTPKTAGGKGWRPETARLGAIGEATERFSGVFRGNETRVISTLVELGPDGFDPQESMLFSTNQHQAQHELNDQQWDELDMRHFVPRLVDPDAPREFTPGWNLASQRQVWLPTEFCFYNYRSPWPRSSMNEVECYCDSNGTASGSTLTEAITHGLLELVERDAVGIWWFNEMAAPPLSLAGLSREALRAIDMQSEAGRSTWLLDLTTDLGVPVVAALSSHGDGQIAFGFAAHFELDKAKESAVLELLQIMLRTKDFDRPDSKHAGGTGARFWQEATLTELSFLTGDTEARPAGASCPPDTNALIATLNARGISTLVVDQSRPDLPLKVAKVIAPGLRHFWARLAPGRLYDVPVALGRRTEVSNESELNTWPIWL